jgi:hypothetical protein
MNSSGIEPATFRLDILTVRVQIHSTHSGTGYIADLSFVPSQSVGNSSILRGMK